MRRMIAYCGLDCEKCDAYLATIHDDQALREKTAIAWSALNRTTILPQDINCQGCRADGIKTVFCDSLCIAYSGHFPGMGFLIRNTGIRTVPRSGCHAVRSGRSRLTFP